MLSVIVPAFNESSNLRRNIPKLIKYLNSKRFKYEIIVSEDGSTDGTCEVLNNLSKKHGIRYTHSEKRLGKGLAIKKAAKLTKYGKVIFIDADLPINLNSIIKIYRELDKNDVVIGSRYVGGSKAERTFKRLLLSRIYHHFLIKFLFPRLKVRDVQCGFKGIRRDVLVSLNGKIWCNDGLWDLEFLAMARKKGFAIKEIPIEWRESKKTTKNLSSDIPKELLEIMFIRLLSSIR
ncbi:MAG: glycosyltransferase [Candidatus Aenigmarchaeota archaeon]